MSLTVAAAVACLLAGVAPAGAGGGSVASTGVAPGGGGTESLSGSYVALDTSVGGDTCFLPGVSQTFCFRAQSYTPDWEYVNNLWLRFPTDWTVTNVYLQGTPACTGGGTWGAFGWTFQTSPYEVNIAHTRYQASTDDCTAYYCVEVTPGAAGPSAPVSWYWDGDGYNSTPHWPCSSDGYTPAGQGACDQATQPPAEVPGCAVTGLFLTPPAVALEACAGTPLTRTLTLMNYTGSAGTFALAYDVPGGHGTLTGPASVGPVADGGSAAFDVTLQSSLCVYPSTVVEGAVTASGNGYSDSSTLTQTMIDGGTWVAVPASSPGWAGVGYPVDGCTARNAGGQWVTYVIGDTSGYSGFWGYNHATNAWATVGATATPADRWAPDWAYDEVANLCYLTGGATAAGGGNLAEAYRFDPVANAFTQLGSFTSVRDFHDSWVGTIDGVKYLCVGGGVNSSSVLIQSTQCYDLAQAAPGAWNAENAQMGAYPTDPFGAADGVLHAPGGDQLWYVGGAINNFATVTDEARYWDDADNAWHSAGNTGLARYRVEGDFVDGDFYQVGGSSGGFSPTADVRRGHFDGATWVWTAMPSLANARMDNVVAATDTVWSVDGYGATASSYVERLAFCPACTELGTLQGNVADLGPPTPGAPLCSTGSVHVDPPGLDLAVDAAGSYGPVELITSLEYGDYALTASASGYAGATATGVQITTGATTTQDFLLARPVLDWSPAGFDVTVANPGDRDELLALSNLGYVPALDFELLERTTILLAASASPISPPVVTTSVEVDPALWTETLGEGRADVLVHFAERAELEPALRMGWHERGHYVVDALRATAERTQKGVRRYLDSRGVKYTPFWIASVIAVSGSDRGTLEGLLAFPEIRSIAAPPVVQLHEPVAVGAATGPRAVEPNLAHVEADQVWGMGVDGAGIVVANIDTGVRYTHEALVSHYRGTATGSHDHNWYDPDNLTTSPSDGHSHGSHTMGTMVGSDGGANQIGMAPGAQWIACAGCPGGGCTSTALLGCAQWIAAPTTVGGASPDPDMRPHVVNNSWGDCSGSYDGWYQSVVDAWHAAGVYPVFSTGNASNCSYSQPPGCNTVGNPGRYGNVTGVGSTGQANGVYAPHSNWGPTDNADTVNPNGYPSLKPQVVAPGVNIRSAYNSGDSTYGPMDGTSMSAPHVAGLVALMWQAAPCLVGDYAATETLIEQSATPIPYASACGGEGPGNLPNLATGWGEINAYQAVQDAMTWCGTDWLPWVSESPELGSVPAGSSQDVTLSFTCSGLGDVAGFLRVLHDDPCQASPDIPLALHCVPPEADLAVTKTDGVDTAVPGATVTYTVTVSNAGPSDVASAAVADTMPAALTNVTWTCSGAGGGTCAASGVGSIADTVGLPAGASVVYTVTGAVDPAATGTLVNTATVTPPADPPDPNGANNSATDTDTLVPSADLAIAKTDGVAAVVPGMPVTYTITVTNAGPSSVSGATVADTFPAALTGVSWTCAGSGGGTCAASGSGPIADTANLPAGGSVTYTALATVDPAATGTLVNTATVSHVADATTANNTATDTDALTSVADLRVTKTDGRCHVLPTESTTYTMRVGNLGPSSVAGVTVTDDFPAALTGVSWTCAATGGASCPASGAGDFSHGVNLPVGGEVVYTATGTVAAGATGVLLNQVSATVPAGVTDPTPVNLGGDFDALEVPVFCDDFDLGTTGNWSSTQP